jgi:hypothetical protein
MRKQLTIALAVAVISVPNLGHAVSSSAITDSIKKADSISFVEHTTNDDIVTVIRTLLRKDPLKQGRVMTDAEISDISTNIVKASVVTGVDWKLLLAISYVESNICHKDWLRGDKKSNKSGKYLSDFWSVGCGQIHLKWWGEIISDAGLTQEDLLSSEYNLIISGLILKHKQDRYGYWGGVRRYNGTGQMSYNYLAKVKKVISSISG